MILVEDDSLRSPDKDLTPLLNDASGSAVSPPAYAPRETGAGPSHQPSVVKRRQPAARRFCSAFLIACGIWILVSALLGSILHSAGILRSPWQYPTIAGITMDCKQYWPDAQKENPIHATFPYSVELGFGIPLPPETFLLLSQGSLSAGTLKIVTEVMDMDMALVEITAHYFTKDIRDGVKLCLVSREEGEWGMAFLTPRYWRRPSRNERLLFEVVLTLPRHNSSLYVNRLATDLVNFEQSLEALEDIVHFGALSLKGSNGGIHVKTLEADNVTFTTTNGAVSADRLVSRSTTVTTSNADISGIFKAAESVDLRTSNAPIQVDIHLDAGNSSEIKNVAIKTSNDNLQSSIYLGTATNASGSFRVKQETSNGQLMANIVTLPLGAALEVAATTSNSPVVLNLPSTYEGDIEIYASDMISARRARPFEQDPASLGRPRTFETRMLKMTALVGSVFWDRKNVHRGSATAKAFPGVAGVYF